MSFWIYKYNLGIKKILVFESVFIFLTYIFVDNFLYFLIVNFLPFFFLSFLMFQFGFFIRLKSFEVNKKNFSIVYYFLPRDLNKSFKGIRYEDSFESKVPIFNKSKLLYFNILESLLKFDDQFIKSALILGGAGAAVPLWLSKNFKINQILVVEISKEMVQIAKKYFVRHNEDKIKFIREDAVKYLNVGGANHEFVFLDVFDGYHVDKNIMSPIFIKNLKKSVNGLLVINFGINYKEGQNDDVFLLFKTYKKIIPELKIFIVGASFIGIYTNFPKNKNFNKSIGTRIL